MSTNAFDVERHYRRVSGPTRVTVGTTAVVLLAENPDRKGFIIQNVGTTPIRLSLGATNPTATVYTLVLVGGMALDDGKGATYLDSQWTGEVRAISDGSGVVVVTEIM